VSVASAKMSKEAQRIMAKYPGHVPVICARPEESDDKKKFLIPVSMGGKDFAATVCEKCPWASANAIISAGGNILSGNLKLTAAELHEKYKAQDGFLYVHVSQAPAADAGAADAGAAVQRTIAKLEDKAQGSASTDKPADTSQPCVFHMPLFDQKTESVSDEAKRVQKVITKYPDLLPVFVRQAATAGLPDIDKKLLVPRPMTCANLQGVLPTHLGLPVKDGQAEKWKALRIFMGDIPIPPEFVMSSVYDQSVDEDDGGLHLTLRLEGHTEEKGRALEWDSADTVAILLAEAIEVNNTKDALLVETREKMGRVLAEAEARASDAESRLQDKLEELLVTKQSSFVETSMRQDALDEALAKVTELTNQLKKSEEARKAAEEALSDDRKLLEDAQSSVARMSHLLTVEKAEKERAQAREKQLADKLAALEEGAVKGCSSWPADKNDGEADGWIDLGWDGDGFSGGLGDEFEVVTGLGR